MRTRTVLPLLALVAFAPAVHAAPVKKADSKPTSTSAAKKAVKKPAPSAAAAKDPAALARTDWGKVTGWVVDAATRKPIPSAAVAVETRGEFAERGKGAAETDASGRFQAHAPLGRISANVDMMRLLTMHPFSLLFSPKAMMKETRIVDVDRLNVRVTCPGYKPFLGPVRAAEADAERYSVRLEDVWLAPEGGTLVSFSPDNFQHERIESFTVKPAVCGPGETITVTLVARLPVDRKERYTAFLTSNNPRLVTPDTSLKAQPTDPEDPTRVVFARAVKVELKPNERYAELGFYLVRNGKTPLVEPETKVLVQSVISDEERQAAVLIEDGYRQARRGEADSALQRYEAARKVAPRYTLAHLLYGDLCLRAGRSQAAVEAYAKLVELSPGDWDVARPRHILALMQIGDLPAAAAEVQGAEEKTKAVPPQIYLYRARIAALQGRFDDADRDLTKASHLIPIPAATTQEINLRRMQAAVQAQPDAPEIRLAYARVLGSSGRWHEALAQTQAALRLNPQDPWATIDLATALRQVGRGDDAHQALERALQLDPGNAEARLLIAESLRERGDYAAALPLYREIAAAEPLNPRARQGLALLLLHQDDRGGARKELLEMVQLSRAKGQTEDNGMAISFQAIYFGPKRRFVSGYSDAQGAAGRVILECLDSLDGNPKNALAWQNIGGALVQLGDGKLALDALDKALALDPSLPEARFYRALALRQSGQFDAARVTLEAVVAANPLHPRARLELARVYTDGGELQQAQSQILAHAKNYPEERRTAFAP